MVTTANMDIMWSHVGRIESINGKKYVLIIVDDYSRYTWTHFLRSKDETPRVLIDFLTLVQRGLHAQVTIVQTDKGTEFLNKTLQGYFAKEEIRHKTSTARTHKQNGIVERRNRTLIKVAQTMLSAAKVPLDGENLDKIKEKGDACIFVGYSTQSKAYRVFNKRTRIIVETIHVNFDVCLSLESESLPVQKSQENVSQAAETETTSNELELLYSLMFSELLNGTSPVVSKSTYHWIINSTHQTPTQVPTVTAPENIIQAKTNTENAQFGDDEFINIFSTPVQEQQETLSRHVDLSNMHTFYQHHPSAQRWTKDHPLEQVIGNPSQSIRTRHQLETGWRNVSVINQAKYAQEILNKHGMTSCDSIGTPMATKHLDADLSGTPYSKDTGFELTAFSDSDHAGCLASRKSTCGGIQFLGGYKLVSWSSKKQDCTSMSSAEAETEYQLADLFTKALSEDRFKYHVRRFGMRCLTPDELEVLAIESA
ncbi:retrovirus-related pol polyprotein from transposon TNT 1-94 [Tanacetum coccineum]|uniref:Retrovirus-related pol polyprotein from transposon TNT 1-94 n=1 Tax=Tanacetum coccineum TaxID=301880 RepID=A0ABQ5FI26_9ASTR